MADITYKKTFAHSDWVDGESIVQASGPDGFNIRFHGCEQEFDTISATFGTVDTAFKSLQKMTFLQAHSPSLDLPANSASEEFSVENYDPATQPDKVHKVYFVIVIPIAGSTNIQHTFLYQNVAGGKIGVTVRFFNQDSSQSAKFNFRIQTLSA